MTTQQSAMAHGAQPPQPLRVLVVDDVPVQRRMLARQLSTAGYAVETANDGNEALARVLMGVVDILITDRDMPSMDGATLCRRVREAKLAGYVFILMLTGQTSVHDLVTGLESGADEYVRKPIDSRELLARLAVGSRILRLERELRAAKATDGLLEIFRRDYLDEQLARDIERAWRYDSPLTVVMADLDHFKRVNDEHGHGIGDQVLKGFCECARSSLRRADWIARYGGEEFALVLPQTGLAGAMVVAEKIRAQFAAQATATSGRPISITASFGIACLPLGMDAAAAATDLLRRADTALYRSKQEGRNRVTAAKDQGL